MGDTFDKPWTHYRAKVASLSRDRKADDPELLEARRDLHATRLADHIEKVLAGEPALTDAQRQEIALLVTESRA